MLRHMDVCLKTSQKDVAQILLSHSQSSLGMKTSKFDQNKYRVLLTAAVVMHDLSFSFVQYKGIRARHSYLNEEVKHVSRNTCKSDVLSKYKKEKCKLKKILESIPGRISLTFDLWTSIATYGYITITAHYIDNDWNLEKKLLNFSYMPPPHSGVAICQKVYNLLADWKIENKLFAFTLDNASSNDVFVELLRSQLNLKQSLLLNGDLFHVRCCAHVLNLIVRDGLKELDSCVVKIRESIKYIKGCK